MVDTFIMKKEEGTSKRQLRVPILPPLLCPLLEVFCLQMGPNLRISFQGISNSSGFSFTFEKLTGNIWNKYDSFSSKLVKMCYLVSIIRVGGF